MKILIFNWRDIKNPSSGGAEILTHEIAKRWSRKGHLVTQFSSEFDGCSREESIDGVQIIRRGHPDARYLFKSVHFQAFLQYIRNFRGKFDIVIDEIHGLPFFTPWYVKEKKVALICEVAHEIWDTAFNFPFNKLGKFIENNYFRFYRNICFVTISPSTRDSLVGMGIPFRNITVLPMGITKPLNLRKFEKASSPTLIFVGRLSKAKGIEDVVFVLKNVLREFPSARLWIIGRGDESYEKYLKSLSKDLGLEQSITFFGFVEEEKKFELMGKADILLAPSVKEGWGLIIGEAGISQTPAIVYNVPGLKDTVINEKTGLIVDKDPKAMAKAVIRLLKSKTLYNKLQKGADNLAKTYSWDNTAKVFTSVIESVISRK